ncbi:MAG: hypothetical protein GC184_13690 [Rhizobiales bacterium]|nr:hypothetical protein [Hyphomicrobiales bacterium]
MDTAPSVTPDPGAIKLWFAQVNGKIDEIHAAIFATSGWLVFKTHTHSTEDLLSNNPTLEGIRSLLGQIDNVVQSWLQSDTADAPLAQFYYDNRILVEQRLSSLRAEIIARKPTFWEAILHTIGHLLQLVRKLLPALPAMLLRSLGIRVDAMQQHLQERSDDLDDLIDGLLRR